MASQVAEHQDSCITDVPRSDSVMQNRPVVKAKRNHRHRGREMKQSHTALHEEGTHTVSVLKLSLQIHGVREFSRSGPGPGRPLTLKGEVS